MYPKANHENNSEKSNSQIMTVCPIGHSACQYLEDKLKPCLPDLKHNQQVRTWSLKEDLVWWLPKISLRPPEISTMPDARTHSRLGGGWALVSAVQW